MTLKSNPLTEIAVDNNKVKIVSQFKFLGEIIPYNLNEKLSIQT